MTMPDQASAATFSLTVSVELEVRNVQLTAIVPIAQAIGIMSRKKGAGGANRLRRPLRTLNNSNQAARTGGGENQKRASLARNRLSALRNRLPALT